MQIKDVNEFRERDADARRFMKFVRAKAMGGHVRHRLEELYGPVEAEAIIKSAVPALGSDDVDPSIGARRFLELTRRTRLLGRLEGTVSAEFNRPTPPLTTGAVASFVAENEVGTMTAPGFGQPITLASRKIVSHLGLDRQFLRSSPQAEGTIEREIRRTTTKTENEVLLDDQPASHSRPAGLRYGLASVGTTSPGGVRQEVEEVFGDVRGGNPERPYFVASPRGGLFLSMAVDELGGKLFPNARATNGGDLAGVPLLIEPAAGSFLFCIDATALVVAEGGLDVDVSTETALAMDDGPSSPSQLVSAFQTGISFVRFTRTINWELGYADGVAYCTLPLGS
jgi:hypothetical protein